MSMPKSRSWHETIISIQRRLRENEREFERLQNGNQSKWKMFRAEHKIYREEQKWNLIHGEFNEITREREYKREREREYKREREKNEKRVQRVYTKMKYLKY